MKKKFSIRKSNLYQFFLLLAILFMGIGYAAVNGIELDVNGSATAMAQSGIYITNVEYKEDINANAENSEIIDFYKTNLHSNIALSENASSSITYTVTVYNQSNYDVFFRNITYDDSLEFYSNPDIICEVSLPIGTVLNSSDHIVFDITFKYDEGVIPSNYVLNSYIDFNFSKKQTVNYLYFSDDSSLPTIAYENESFSVTLPNDVQSIKVYENNRKLSTNRYTFSNYELTIDKVNGDITIMNVENYFVDGSSQYCNGVTITPHGDSTYEIDGTVYSATYVRLTDVFKCVNDSTQLPDANPLTTIYSSGTQIKYDIESLSGSYNVLETNKFRFLGRTLDNKPGFYFDFYDFNLNTAYSPVIQHDISMFSLYLVNDASFDHFVFKINLEPIIDNSEIVAEHEVLQDKQFISTTVYKDSSTNSDFNITMYEDNYYMLHGRLDTGTYYISLDASNFNVKTNVDSLYYYWLDTFMNPPTYLQNEFYKMKYTPVDMSGVDTSVVDELSFYLGELVGNGSYGVVNHVIFSGELSSINCSQTVETEALEGLPKNASLLYMTLSLNSPLEFDSWLFKLDLEKSNE